MGKKKNPRTKRQHYVAQHYLRGFTNDSGIASNARINADSGNPMRHASSPRFSGVGSASSASVGSDLADGAEALARVERDCPDLMVLDLVMPRRSGFTVLERMSRTSRRSTPVIMMTGNDEFKHREAAAQRGVSVFLSKPFAIEELLSEIDTILEP